MSDLFGNPVYDESEVSKKFSPEELAELRKKVKPYIMEYVLWAVANKPGAVPEFIHQDLLFHCLTLRCNQLAKEVILYRKMAAGEKEEEMLKKAEFLFKEMRLVCDCIFKLYKVNEPKDWSIFQNEFEDDMDVIDAKPTTAMFHPDGMTPGLEKAVKEQKVELDAKEIPELEKVD